MSLVPLQKWIAQEHRIRRGCAQDPTKTKNPMEKPEAAEEEEVEVVVLLSVYNRDYKAPEC